MVHRTQENILCIWLLKGITQGWARWRRCIEQGMWEWTWSFHVSSGLSILWGLLCLSCCSVTGLCLTLCNLMQCSTPGFPVHHQLPELAQTHVHWVGDAIQPSHPLSSPSPPALSLSQCQVFSNESVLHIRGPKYWSFSFKSVFPMNIQDWFTLGWTG